MPCSWEGNHRSGVALTMPHGLILVVLYLRAQSLGQGDEHLIMVS